MFFLQAIKFPKFAILFVMSRSPFTFKLVQPNQRDWLVSSLSQGYIQEWLHGAGLKNLLVNLDRFFQGTSDSSHWVAYDEKGTPFAYLLTHEEENEALSMDLFICDPRFLGKGFSVPLIHQFLLSQFKNKKTIFIDPEVRNTRAVHVYQKAGFEIIGEFIASWHPVPHYKMKLDLDKMKLDLEKLKNK